MTNFRDSAGRRKNTGNRPLKHSKTYLKRSTSSFDLQFNFVGQLGPVKESDDEGLTIPFEPEDSSDNGESGGYHLQKLKHMRGLVSKGILVDSFIKGVKRDIVFKEEAKDELHELPSVIDIAKKSNRLTSPEPLDLPSDLKRMSYKELNKFGMSAFSTPSPTEIGQLSPGVSTVFNSWIVHFLTLFTFTFFFRLFHRIKFRLVLSVQRCFGCTFTNFLFTLLDSHSNQGKDCIEYLNRSNIYQQAFITPSGKSIESCWFPVLPENIWIQINSEN